MTGALETDEQPAPLLSLSDIQRRIDNLNISSDAKMILSDLAAATTEIGGKIVSAGRRILSFIFDLVKRFPNTAFGLIVGYVLSALLASIPFLGPLLAALIGPLLLALGIGAGALADLKDRAFISRVEVLENEFNALSHHGR